MLATCAVAALLAVCLVAHQIIAPDHKLWFESAGSAQTWAGNHESDGSAEIRDLPAETADGQLADGAQVAEDAAAGDGSASSPYELNSKDMAAVKNKSGKVFTFALMEGQDAPEIASEDRQAILEACAKIEKQGNHVGVVLVDLQTGNGVGYNISKKVFGASSIKASAVCWVMQNYVDKGKAKMNASYPSGIYNDDGMLTVTGSTPLKALMENAIVNSDNADYLALRNDFNLSNYAKWLESCGVNGSMATNDTDFPHYSARDAACMWLKMVGYMKSGSENGQLLASWLGGTNVSFIREALEGESKSAGGAGLAESQPGEAADDSGSQVDEPGVTVRNKAGWNPLKDYESCCDNAYITVGEREYVLCVMSDAPAYGTCDDPAVKRLMNVASATFGARGALG